MYQDNGNSDPRRGHRVIDVADGAPSPPADAPDVDLPPDGDRRALDREQDSEDLTAADLAPVPAEPDGDLRTADGDLRTAEPAGGPPADRTRLVPVEAVERLRGQWRDAQSMFVDDPPAAVGWTRTLLADFVRSVADELDERGRRPGPDASTEDLRHELRQYRDAFHRLAEV